MKLVGGRLNIKKIKRQILSQQIAELCKSLLPDVGDIRTSWASDILMGKGKAARENRQKMLFCGSIMPFGGKITVILSLLSHISSRHCWWHWAGWALSVTWCHRARCSQHLRLQSAWTQAGLSPVTPTVLGARPTSRTESSLKAGHTEQSFRIFWLAVSTQVQPALAIPHWKAVQWWEGLLHACSIICIGNLLQMKSLLYCWW